MNGGWYKESRRHSLARKGVKSAGQMTHKRFDKIIRETNKLINQMSYEEIKKFFELEGQEHEFLDQLGDPNDWKTGEHQTLEEARTAGARQLLKENWDSFSDADYQHLRDHIAKYRWFNANKDTQCIINSVREGIRTRKELKRCGCANCQTALKYLEVA